MTGKALLVNFVPTGMVPTKESAPFVPITPNEIIEEVHEASELGITLVHLHARDDEGQPTYKANVYAQILDGINRHCPELVTCVSLSGRNFNEFEKRSEALSLYPDMASLTLSSMNFSKSASVNSPEMIISLAQKMAEYGVNPELEVFDLGMINYAKYLLNKAYIKGPLYFNIILGNVAGMQAEMATAGLAVSQLPQDALWSFGGIGTTQLRANTLAIAQGGGVRIGLEDNIYYDQKSRVPATNISLLKRIHEIAVIFERPIMAPKTLGELGFYNKKKKEMA